MIKITPVFPTFAFQYVLQIFSLKSCPIPIFGKSRVQYLPMEDFRACFFTTKVGRSRRDRRTGDIVQYSSNNSVEIPPGDN